MTFFYDLNKKLDEIRATPSKTHGQLNERDEGKPGKNFEKIAKDAAKRYGSKAAGERVAGAVRNKLKAQGKLEEEGMSRAAKGYEKYGKEGMEALAKAGREGKPLDKIRAKYDKYDEGIEDRIGDLDMTNPVNQPTYQRKAAAQGGSKKDFPRFSGGQKPADMPKSHEGFPRYSGDAVKETGGKPMTAKQKSFAKLAPPADKITFADKIAGAKKEVDEMLGDVAAEAMKSALKGGQKKLDKNNNGKLDANDFAMLRKGGKQETDEATNTGNAGDTIRQIYQQFYDKGDDALDYLHDRAENFARYWNRFEGDLDSMIAELPPKILAKLARELQGLADQEGVAEGWDDMMKDAERRRNTRKVGDITHGSKHDVEEIPGGRRVTRRTDPNTGYSVGADDDTPASGEKRGRGRPKGSKAALGAKGPSGKSKLMTKEGDNESDDIKQAMSMLKKAGYKVTKAAGAAEELDEKAVSKAQQRFMGMVHATQKGEKAPSKEVAKVAKSMGKKDAEDFAATKHKGLPEKKKPEGKKKEKTEEAGGTGTPTASSGFSFGKGIYDSMNRELEEMIAESMNISMSMNTDANGGPSKSLTVTATDDDAMKLGQMLKMAGLSHGDDEGYGGTGYKSACGCGTPDCGCDTEEVDEAYGDNVVSDNQPDWPTNTETSDDALQYSGGLNKPKASGMATIPVTDVQVDGEDNFSKPARMNEDDELARIKEMAGVEKSNQINEGLLNNLKDMIVPKLMKMLGADAEKIASAVKQATGGDLTPSKENAMKVVQALGIDAAAAKPEMSEGIAGNWQGKLIQSLYTLGLLGSAGAAASMWNTVGGSSMAVIGTLLLMFANSFFGDAPGQTGAMGKFGNKGTSARKGLDDWGRPVTNYNVDEDDLGRMMEMAGVKKKTDEEKTEEGNLFTGNLAKARAAGKKQADLDGDGDMEKVDESILSATANLWSEYKGKYGV